MIEITAPWPATDCRIYLPNPKFGDSESLAIEMNPKRAMDGTLYTYIKTKGLRRKLIMSFTMTRLKSIELNRFLLMYISQQIKIVDHLSRSWIGYITSNPVEFNTSKRGNPGGGNELVDVELEFEGILV
jgi:hypothetical protein